MMRLLVASAILLVSPAMAESDRDVLHKRLFRSRACRSNPDLAICQASPSSGPAKMIVPPPIPASARRRDSVPETAPAIFAPSPVASGINPADRPVVGWDDREDRTHIHIRPQLAAYAKAQNPMLNLTAEQTAELQRRCLKIAPIAQQDCVKKTVAKGNVARCAAFFRDCSRFLQSSSPLSSMADDWGSGVGVNLGFNVNGIPYYPVNEEGAIGAAVQVNAPFGSWGGGYSGSVGVRDYWNQYQEAGGNWKTGTYGYKNGWSVPLVQSLGIEGGQHNTVSVPLDKKHFGEINVDNGYGVGPYYGHNDHVGVNWRRGDVQHLFGVESPFVGAGFQTGQAVTFPGFDTWAAALG